MAGKRPSGGTISGAFNPKSFKKVLSLLERNGFVGCLQVTKGDSAKFIYFTVGGVRLHVTGPMKKVPIGKMLVRYGKVKPSQLDDAITIQKRTGRRMGDVLVKFMKVVTAETIQQMVQRQVENEIIDLITWEAGVYHFHEQMQDNLFDGKVRATTVSVDLEELVALLLEHLEQWTDIKEKVPDLRSAFKLTKAGQEELSRGNFGGLWAEFANLLDGKRSLAELSKVGEFSLFETYEIAAELIGKEWIVKVVTGGAFGDEFEDAEDAFEEIKMLEQAIEVSEEDEVLHFRLAHAYKETGQKEKAARTYRELGLLKLDNYRVDEAIEVVEKSILLNPNDFDSQEILFELYRRHRPVKAAAHGIRLADIYKTNRLPNRTKKILLQILEREPKHIRARSMLAEVYTTLEEIKPAVAQYEQIAQLLKEEKKDEARLKEVYEKILILDEVHRYAKKELRRLYFRGAREVGRYVRIAVVVLVFLVCAAAVFYELWGRWKFSELRVGVKRRMENGQLEQARTQVEEFQRRFFLTRAAPEVKKIQLAIDSQETRLRNVAIYDRLPVFRKAIQAGAAQDLSRHRTEISDLTKDPDLSPRLRSLLERILDDMDEVLGEHRNLESAVSEQDYAKAHKALIALLGKIGSIRPEKSLTIEIPLVIDPPEASVFVDGAVWERKSLLALPVAEKKTVRFELPGYETRTLELDAGNAPWPVKVNLNKETVWRSYLGGAVSLPPLRSDRGLVTVTETNRIATLVEESGHLRRSRFFDITQTPAAPPYLEKGRLYCPLLDGSLAVLDSEKMTLLSTTPTGAAPVATPLRVDSPRRGLLVPCRDGRLLLWEDETQGFSEIADLKTRLTPGIVFFDDVVLFGDMEGRLTAYDLKMNGIKWRRDLGAPLTGPPQVFKGSVYAATERGEVWGLYFVTGRPAQGWPYRSGSTFSTALEISDDLLLVGSPDKHVYAVNRQTGNLDWKFYVGSPVSSPCTLYGRTVYFGTQDGRLCAVAVDGQVLRWSQKTGGPVRTRPLIVGKKIIFGSDDGHLYAIWE